jgi:hypothetical protein
MEKSAITWAITLATGTTTCGLAALSACGDDPVTGGATDASVVDTSVNDSSHVGQDAADSGTSSDASDAAVEADAPFSCPAFAEAGVPDGGDGGLVCSGGKWRDHDAASCKDCPAMNVTCSTLLSGTSPAYDYSSRVITTTLAAGTAQIVAGSADVVIGQCYSGGQMSVETRTGLAVSVEGNTLKTTVPQVSAKAPCGTITYTLLDACCKVTVAKVNLVADYETGNIVSRGCPDGG